MPIIDWNKSAEMYDKIKTKLNSGELANLIILAYHDLNEHDRISTSALLKNTGYLQPYVKPGILSKCPHCHAEGMHDFDSNNMSICPVCKNIFELTSETKIKRT